MTKLYLITCCLLLAACGVAPQPINYGSDQCANCKMNIVDKAHAGQVVTSKGRAYKFDAIECMINYLKDNAQVDYAHMLVADFSQPGELIPASDAKYLISKDIPSPMGMFLSAFPNEASLNNTLKKVNGKSYTWDQIQDEVH